MVDVGEKAETAREAEAAGAVVMLPETAQLVRTGGAAKGDVLAVARLAGIMAAKRTSDLIPLCHPIPLTSSEVDFEWDDSAQNRATLVIRAVARTVGKTGVEMEALTAVTVAALTVYDMCKAVDRGLRIEGIRLLRKSGGKRDYQAADAAP